MATAQVSNAGRKQAIRDAMRETRRGLSAAEQRRHGWLLTLQVTRQSWFRRVRRVALYLPMDGEIDVRPLMRLCWRLGKAVYLPRINSAGDMEFVAYRPQDSLSAGKYGLLQPRLSRPAVKASQLDVVFAPLVAFSARGGRLGMGGGYYDRALAGSNGALLVGLAHSCQQVPELPADTWDVKMSLVITETGATRPPFGKLSFSRTRLRPR